MANERGKHITNMNAPPTMTGKAFSDNEVYIITTGRILNAKTAGARRVRNIAKSIASANAKVIIFSYCDFNGQSPYLQEIDKGVYSYVRSDSAFSKPTQNLVRFLRVSNSYMRDNSSEAVVFLYPTTFIFRDFIYLLFFKYLKGYRFFCEINELRSAIAFSSKPPSGLLRKFKYLIISIRDYIIYSMNEWQVGLYDGISVISVALERHFSTRARKIIRIPILCDSDEINAVFSGPLYNGELFKICFAGYIKIDKEGFDILLEALDNLNRRKAVSLYLYGIIEKEDAQRLTQIVLRLGLSGRVHYMGNIEPEFLVEEFKKYHLLVLPRPLTRRTRFGLSTKLADYIVSGIPVLVTDVSDNALIIQDNHNGFIIPPGSSELLTDRILGIIDTYGTMSSLVVGNAKKTAQEKLDYRLFSQAYMNFFFGINRLAKDYDKQRRQ